MGISKIVRFNKGGSVHTPLLVLPLKLASTEQHQTAEELTDEVDARFSELEAEIERLEARRQAYDPDDIARGGAFVILNHLSRRPMPWLRKSSISGQTRMSWASSRSRSLRGNACWAHPE